MFTYRTKYSLFNIAHIELIDTEQEVYIKLCKIPLKTLCFDHRNFLINCSLSFDSGALRAITAETDTRPFYLSP